MAAKKTTKSAAKPAKQKNAEKDMSRCYEIIAICVTALSIFFGISIYSNGGGAVGTFISSVLLGLFGTCAYLLPVLLAAAMIYFLFAREKGSVRKKLIMSLAAFIDLTAIFHMFFMHIKVSEFLDYYRYAALRTGGGLIGACLSEPLKPFIGTVFTNIVFIAVFIILFNCIFDISAVRCINGLVKLVSSAMKSIRDDIDIIKEENKTAAQSKSTDDNDEIRAVAHTEVKVDPRKIKDAEHHIRNVESQFESMPHDLTINLPDGKEIIKSNGEKEFIDREIEVTGGESPEPKLSEKEKQQLDNEIKREMETTAAEQSDSVMEYSYPATELLSKPKQKKNADSTEELQQNAKHLIETLHSFKVDAQVVEISRGPTVTRYEIRPAEGVKVSQITSLSKDIALSLAAEKDVMVAPVPGKSTIGIELANKNPSVVSLREVLESEEFKNHPSKLAVALGKDISGKPIIMDLAKMPHLLIAGATGAGKSVCINTLVMSILYKANPNEVKLVMVDPKQVELGVYNGIPHLLIPVVKDAKKATGALGWAVNEMTDRYSIFERNNVRNIQGYNELMEHNGTPEGKMPSIVILIDEFADLMMVAPGDVENYVCRIAQLARAAGMHLVIATQRPVVKFITGNIKANVPSRISFMVASVRDSQTILDMGGAEKLIGKGDMLYMPVGETKPSRMQCAFVSDADVKKVVEAVSSGFEPSYDETVIEQLESDDKYEPDGENPGDADVLLPEAIEMAVMGNGTVSTSMIQRKFRIGYNRAGSIIDQMEARGIISEPDGNRPRQVLITKEQYDELRATGND